MVDVTGCYGTLLDSISFFWVFSHIIEKICIFTNLSQIVLNIYKYFHKLSATCYERRKECRAEHNHPL